MHWDEETLSREEELLEKIEEWRAKANSESDSFNKYISVFIAYNIFYNLYAKSKSANPQADFTQGDSKRAEATISLIEAGELFPLIESDLREYVTIIPIFRNEHWSTRNSPKRVAIAETLKESLHAKNAKRTIDMLIKWLYKVRCNLVHGEKSYRDDNQRKLLEMSTRLLDMILVHLVSRYKQKFGI